jgi:cellulose synthase/poly-beta-1,6-N-acetylglucosamine synthase-like glycosyltransferase
MMTLILVLYCIALGMLALYGINCHVLIHLFKRRIAQRPGEDQRLLSEFYRDRNIQELPMVTSQLPIYNEMNVTERLIDAVVTFDYPEGKHEIQILDDSTDETSQIIAQKVKTLKAAGVQIEHIRRSTREGFKAGALKHGLEKARGEFLAVFDADFVPPRDFLLKTIPFFLLDPHLGLVQSRWGHLNSHESLITCLQSIGINGHFMVEQSARNWNGLFMNFNGTAGIFRKKAILEAGNWKADTLTEDLDLSYRMQFVGWRCRYLIDLVSPAEIPENVNAFKSQQFRWAKGSIQTAMKLLPSVWKSAHPLFKKLQATLHLTHYLVHPLMVYIAITAPLLLLTQKLQISPILFAFVGVILLLSCTGPSRLYWTAETYLHGIWNSRLLLLPFLVCFGCGLGINNTRAVLEAIWGRKSEFVRTPKKGNQERKHYRLPLNPLFLLEILVGIWCLSGTFFYFEAKQYLIGHFLLIYSIGFTYVGATSLLHQRRSLQ